MSHPVGFPPYEIGRKLFSYPRQEVGSDLVQKLREAVAQGMPPLDIRRGYRNLFNSRMPNNPEKTFIASQSFAFLMGFFFGGKDEELQLALDAADAERRAEPPPTGAAGTSGLPRPS